MRFPLIRLAGTAAWLAACGNLYAAVTLEAVGRYLTTQGYGGAQLVRSGQFYHMPIRCLGRAGHLVIDTGTPATLIFRSSLRPLQLRETRTDVPVSGAFGPGEERYGVAVVDSFVAGNCTVLNVPVAIAPDLPGMNAYGRPNGLLGLNELTKFGAVLDLDHRMIYLRPAIPPPAVPEGLRSILQGRRGWRAVRLTFSRRHFQVADQANDRRCRLLLDTGAVLTAFDRGFASAAKIPARPTHARAHGMGRSAGDVRLATFGALWIGDYQIKQPIATVLNLDPRLLGRGTPSEIAGFLGVDHLASNSAIIDFASGTPYLRPHSNGPRRGRSAH